VSLEDDIAKVAEQEKRLVFKSFDETSALAIGEHVRRIGEERGVAIGVGIRFWNRPLYYYVMRGTGPHHADWIRRKSNLVKRFERASYHFMLSHRKNGKGFAVDDNVDLTQMAAHGGSFPIRIEGVGVVGTITVAGLPAREDHAIAVEAICRHLGVDYGTLNLGPE
jgi:uncharacterized protein (UPF0303 family)